jgi:universal stress protein A
MPPKTILVPVTLGAGSSAAMAVASRLAQETGGAIVLLHVVQLGIGGEELGVPRTILLHDLCLEAEKRLQALVTYASLATPVEIVVVEGRPMETIVEQARMRQASVLVMATHQARGWRRWLHRQTASRVLVRARCPIWLVSLDRTHEAVMLSLAVPQASARGWPPASPEAAARPFLARWRTWFSSA